MCVGVLSRKERGKKKDGKNVLKKMGLFVHLGVPARADKTKKHGFVFLLEEK